MTNVFDRMVSENDETPIDSETPTEPSESEANDERSSTPSDVKTVTHELLKCGYIEESRKTTHFQRAVVREREISAALEPLDLQLRIDTHRGVAFLKVAEGAFDDTDEAGAWAHPLVRRHPPPA